MNDDLGDDTQGLVLAKMLGLDNLDKLDERTAKERGLYYLEDKTPVLIEEPGLAGLIKWGEHFDNHNRYVRNTRLEVTQRSMFKMKEKAIGFIEVSTVFLGKDHSGLWGKAEPVLFETMIFGGEHNHFVRRDCHWKEAVTTHEAIVKNLTAGTFDEYK